MHVGFFSPALPNSAAPNGIVTYVRVMRDALRALGHLVTIVTPTMIEHSDGSLSNLPPAASKFKILIETRRGPGAWSRLVIRNAFAAARNAGVDIFEMEETYGWASLLKGLPIVLRAHGPHALHEGLIPDYDPRRAHGELSSFAKVGAATFTTQATLDELSTLTTCRFVRVIPNPVEIPVLQWNPVECDPNQIIFVGRIDTLKGADLAIEGFTKALSRRPSLRLLMIGPGDPIPAPPEVQFLGPLRPAQITQLRLQSALALGTSRRETFSYALTEAMALGMPVVTTDWPGAREIIPNGLEGRVVGPSALPSAMLDGLGNASLGVHARMGVQQRLEPSKIARQTLEFYAHVLGSGQRRRVGENCSATVGL